MTGFTIGLIDYMIRRYHARDGRYGSLIWLILTIGLRREAHLQSLTGLATRHVTNETPADKFVTTGGETRFTLFAGEVIGMKGSQSGHPGKMFFNVGRGVVYALAVVLSLALASSGQAPAQQADNSLHTATRMELDVVKVVIAQEKAWNAGDLEGYVKGYKDSPDTLFVGRQISKGYAQILEDYKHNYSTRAMMGTLAFSELEVHPLSDSFVVCLGKYHLDRPKRDGGQADGIFSLVFENTDKGWKIVLDHTT